MFELSETLNPHLVASVLKKYLRDRPFATVPYRCYRSAMLIHESLTDKYAPFSAEECKSFVMNLPGEKQLLFITIARFVFFFFFHPDIKNKGETLLWFTVPSAKTDT